LDQYKALRKVQPLHPGAVLGIARLMRAKRMDFDGQNLLADVLAINPRNPDYWYEMAHFERLLDRTEEVAKAARSAMELSTDPLRVKAIAAEFETELKAVPAPAVEE
jgi:predicted Zn-dependent protease